MNSDATQISVVVPMYNVVQYLPDLLESFENQQPGNYELEFIFIDDGSPDNAANIALDWLAVSGRHGLVLEQVNGGVSAARNAGIELATGQWVTSPDPDDFLSESYFQSFSDLVVDDKFSSVNVIANNIHRYFEDPGETRDNHALRAKFQDGNKVVDLESSPQHLQISAASVFLRKSHLDKNQIKYDVKIKASEDSIYLIDVLLAAELPLLGINADSIYFYRKRAADNSAVDTFRQKRESYFDRFKYGYLRQLVAAEQENREVPRWLMNVVLYELRWLFDAETSMHLKESVLDEQGRVEFLEMIAEILNHITVDAIIGYRSGWLGREIRMLLLALKGEANPDPFVYLKERNHENGLLRLEYYFTGDLPVEKIISGGLEVTPIAGKIQKLNYFDQSVLKMRHLWVPDLGDLTVELDGKFRSLSSRAPGGTNLAWNAEQIGQTFARADPAENFVLQGRFRKRRGLRWHLKQAYGEWYAAKYPEKVINGLSREALYEAQRGILARVRRVAWNQESRSKYSSAWVFMDRLGQAQDNAEHMYRWVRENAPHTNIWYVIEEDCPDWERLRKDGFNLVAYRSLEHYKLMMNADHLISSHLDYDVVEPIPRRFYINSVRPWKLTFLQHGIIMNDMSMWLNQKHIDLLVTSTNGERNSIVGDYTNYKFTDFVVKKTGLPRFDGLLAKQDASRKNTILIAPTWRQFLLHEKTGLSARRELIPNFSDTEYFRNWQAVIRDPRLKDLAERKGLEVVFLPHPSLCQMVDFLDIPEHVRVASYTEGDIQDLLTSADAAITDYSSIAFDLVYSGAKLVYFQFDRETVLGGGHIVRAGYFSYDDDGLGPVARDVEGVFDSLDEIMEGYPSKYQDRIEALGWDRDGKACARTFQAILALDG